MAKDKPAKPPHATPDAAEFGRLRAHLSRSGVRPFDMIDATGDGTLTRKQLVDRLAAWLRTRPKASRP